MTVYEIVTESIIEKLKKGAIPWKRPWTGYAARNWVTQKEYQGLNQLLLEPGEYATWNQIKKAGGKVKKGATSSLITFWKIQAFEEENEDGEIEKRTVPFLRYYRVFNIADVEGLEPKWKEPDHHHDPVEAAERIIKNYEDQPLIIHQKNNRAFYTPATDTVTIPQTNQFEKIEEYYSTLFHELVHSTGHISRLNRKNAATAAAFGSKAYSKEELIAEVGASFLCTKAGIDNDTLDNSAAYIQSWLKALENDPRMIVHASSQAQKAVDYIIKSEQ